MYQCVHKSLSNRPIGIIGFVHTGLGFLYEANLGVVSYKLTTVAKQTDQVAFILFVVQSVIEDGTFIKSIPTGSEYSRIAYDILVSHQFAGIGEKSILISQSEG